MPISAFSAPPTPQQVVFPGSPSRHAFPNGLERTRSSQTTTTTTTTTSHSRQSSLASSLASSSPTTPRPRPYQHSHSHSTSIHSTSIEINGVPVLAPPPPVLGGNKGSELEWTEIQSRTFCKWLNTKLESHGYDPMSSLAKDFSDGVKLIQLLEIMSETSLGRYTKKPKMRVQKAENASKALQFIRDRGVKLTNIGPEDIVDGNLKLILGMIWTLILRFTISGITEEGLSAKDGLLLWCQRKTKPYPEVNVQDFKHSFKDGLAFCALIHRHRPELIDWDRLNRNDPRTNTALAFKIAEEHLGIPRLLEVSDICDVEVPDERSVMTYVAEFFHKFSSEDKAETGARRVEKFAEVMQNLWASRNDFERRMAALLDAIQQTRAGWAAASRPTCYPDAIGQLSTFAQYKKTNKRMWVRERQELAQLYSNIQTKLKTYALRPWEPRAGLRLEDLEVAWGELMVAEVARSRAINARIREIKEALRLDFAQQAKRFIERVQRIEQVIGSLQGPLQDQKKALITLRGEIPLLRETLTKDIHMANQNCLEAKVDENDHTVFTYDDLEFELVIAEEGVRKKIAFVDNQMVSAKQTNVTPAKLEEFEATFKHFDKDGTNTLTVYEMHSALASLGIVYPDDEVENIYDQLEAQFGALTYEAWLALLVEITKDDMSSGDQLAAAFSDVAACKEYVTEQDLFFANLAPETVRFLAEVMPPVEVPGAAVRGLDYHGFLDLAFARE